MFLYIDTTLEWYCKLFLVLLGVAIIALSAGTALNWWRNQRQAQPPEPELRPEPEDHEFIGAFATHAREPMAMPTGTWYTGLDLDTEGDEVAQHLIEEVEQNWWDLHHQELA